MALPFFYTENLSPAGAVLALDEATARHITQVLRMKKGDRLRLTDGKGKKLTATIHEQQKKGCSVFVEDELNVPVQQPRVTIAISLLKNASRFEWFLEKATETGVSSIIPLICERTERTHFRMERMKNILVSAMLQSQQCWLPELPEPVRFKEWISRADGVNKYIAHCLDTVKTGLSGAAGFTGDKVVCIGPEGDFTPAEIDTALQHRFTPVSLGNTRLRTETAGIAAAILLRMQ
ncbi:RsmE family RNA methyltransferase [Agriterribacter sp.]|uniref:RsmE family RNA methyltransferase n=1 Tax=Agriterribacter sp. TaxID=2821509 RepID=UPI002BBBFF11|nr:RsmE family RNA methyltransferase [Agriterribacter sp.]HRO47446.1 RsmE family RNA methyltransferase [Agriterribacter sp.]HRQ15897.1 RsmE family RNA methyltransferase [Agriterribacter sp.]